MRAMNKYKWLGVFVIGTIFVQSCQTVDFPEPTNQGQAEPQFLFEGNVNGESINWIAGNENYFMETMTSKDNNGVYNFIGHLKEKGCSGTCPKSLKFIIKDAGPAVSTSNVNINEVLRNGALNLTSDEIQDSLAIKIKSKLPESFEHVLILNDKQFEDLAAEGQYVVGPIKDDFEVILRGEHKRGIMNYQLTQPLVLGQDRQKRLRAQLKVNGRKIKILLNILPANDRTKITWFIGENGEILADGNMLELETVPMGRVQAKVQFDNGQFASFIVIFKESFSASDIQNEAFEFQLDYEPVKVEHKNPKQLKTIEIQYFDAIGNLFSSLNAKQGQDQYFKIQEVEEFLTNAMDQKTRKISFEMNVLVKDDKLEELLIDGSGTFAVAYQ